MRHEPVRTTFGLVTKLSIKGIYTSCGNHRHVCGSRTTPACRACLTGRQGKPVPCNFFAEIDQVNHFIDPDKTVSENLDLEAKGKLVYDSFESRYAGCHEEQDQCKV